MTTRKRKRKQAPKEKGPHGGHRAGAGRPSYFTGKLRTSKQFAILLTRRGLSILDAKRRKVKASRSDFAQALVLIKAQSLRYTPEVLTNWPGKMPRPIALLFNEKGLRTLDAICLEFHKSRSNVLESLLHEHADDVTADAIAELAA